MKKIKKILIISIFCIGLFGINNLSAANIPGLGNIDNNTEQNSINISDSNDTRISKVIENVGVNLLTSVKNIFNGVLLIFLVYVGAQMIMSMGTDDDALSKSKRTIWYTMIGLVFINMPGTIYNAIKSDEGSTAGGLSGAWTGEGVSNLFINTNVFNNVLNDNIIKFIQIGLTSLAIMIIIIAGLKIMTSRGRDEKITEAKNKIIWSIVGLIFIGFIEAWKRFAFSGNISTGTDIFKSIANLLLFLAPPIAIFFLTLAGYYYITSNGDEEKVKKGKNIIINTMLATVILLISYIFLIDLMEI